MFSSVLVLLNSAQALAKVEEPTTASACRAMEAAYTAAIQSRTLGYPTAVEAGWRAIEMRKIVPEYRAELPLSSTEFEGLAQREHLYAIEHYKPRCRWEGKPNPSSDYDGHGMFVSFTNPIMSKDGRLALVEVSFDSRKGFGYGSMCVARAAGSKWSAHCISSWIT